MESWAPLIARHKVVIHFTVFFCVEKSPSLSLVCELSLRFLVGNFSAFTLRYKTRTSWLAYMFDAFPTSFTFYSSLYCTYANSPTTTTVLNQLHIFRLLPTRIGPAHHIVGLKRAKCCIPVVGVNVSSGA